jgi:hypothetical protein
MSVLKAYFEENMTSEHARGILYPDFPEYYRWDSQSKIWIRRAQKALRQVEEL